MLRRLEELALVKRIRTGADHRVAQLQLTAKGERCAGRIICFRVRIPEPASQAQYGADRRH